MTTPTPSDGWEIPDLGERVETRAVSAPLVNLTDSEYASTFDALEGTPFARVRIPPGVTGFGFAEVRFLLARQDSPASRRTAVVLGFDESLDATDVLAAAAASLLGRGLLAVDAAGDFRTAGEAALLESLFATAFRWTTFTYRVDDRADLLVMIESVGQVGLLQARQYGTWFAALPGEVADPPALAATAMQAMADLYGSGTFAVGVRTAGEVPGVRYVSGPDGDVWAVTRELDSDEVLATGTVSAMVRQVLDDLSGVDDVTQDSTPQDAVPRSATGRSAPEARTTEYAPLTWMDYPFRPTAGQTLGFGVVFLLAAVAVVVVLAAHWPGDPLWQTLFVPVLFGALGGWLVWAGRRRLAWRRRNPGEDPLHHERPPWGSAYGPATTSAAVVRLLVLLVAWALALVGAALTVAAASTVGDGRDPVGVQVVAVLLVAAVTAALAAIGWYDLRRIRQLRAARR